jgi:hypothetical protein
MRQISLARGGDYCGADSYLRRSGACDFDQPIGFRQLRDMAVRTKMMA